MDSPFLPYLSTYSAGTVAERPWWRRGVGNAIFVRTDGVITGFYPLTVDGLTVRLDTFDTKNPMADPPVLCGQVWFAAGIANTIVATLDTGSTGVKPVWAYKGVTMPDVWPPAGCVLVYGPGAPWAPVGWSDG